MNADLAPRRMSSPNVPTPRVFSPVERWKMASARLVLPAPFAP